MSSLRFIDREALQSFGDVTAKLSVGLGFGPALFICPMILEMRAIGLMTGNSLSIVLRLVYPKIGLA
jgi:hypothetical protein